MAQKASVPQGKNPQQLSQLELRFVLHLLSALSTFNFKH